MFRLVLNSENMLLINSIAFLPYFFVSPYFVKWLFRDGTLASIFVILSVRVGFLDDDNFC